MKTQELTDLSRAFHDINNTVGSIAMNLEVAKDPELCHGDALESVLDAVAEVRRLKEQLQALRAEVDPLRREAP